jgi:hypothetical protein
MPSGVYKRKSGAPSVNGTGGPVINRLLKLLAQHEAAADAIRTTLELLRADQGEERSARQGSVIEQALTLDAARRAKATGNGASAAPAEKPRHPPGYGARDAERARRNRTVAFLSLFSRDTPIPTSQKRLAGQLAALGYLRRKGEGFLRTAKPYEAAPAHPPGRRAPAEPSAVAHDRAGAATQARRAVTAQLLAEYDRETPKPLVPAVSVLARHGYLKKKGEGYVRTEKAFTA